MTDSHQTDKFADLVARLTSLTLGGELFWIPEYRESIAYPFLTAQGKGWAYELRPDWASPADTFGAALLKQPLHYSLEARHEATGAFIHLPPMLALGVLASAARRNQEQVIDKLLHDLG